MPSLEEIIKQRLVEATEQVQEAKNVKDVKDTDVSDVKDDSENKGTEDKVIVSPKKGKEVVKEEYNIDDDFIVEGFFKNKALDVIHAVKGAVTGKDVSSDHINSLANKMNNRMVSKANIRKRRGDFTDAEFAKHQNDIKSATDDIRGAKNASDAANRIKYLQDNSPHLFENVEDEQKSSVSSQVSALLEAEGLSDEFKLQAVTIFEAAVADRVLQIEEEMKKEFEAQLVEAKEQMNTDIDEFLSEAVATWQKENEVAIKANFNTAVNESFMDGLKALIAEHSVEVPEGKEDAFAAALTEVETLKEASEEQAKTVAALQEQIMVMEGKTILESYRSRMTVVEFDRFVQLVESVKFDNREQYEKQLNIVLENFGQKKTETKPIVESKTVDIPATQIVEKVEDSRMSVYVKALKQR